MRYIHLFLLTIFFLGFALGSSAQQQPAATRIEDKQPPKQELKIIPKEAPADSESANPSPLKRDEKTKQPAGEKTETATVTNQQGAVPGGERGAQTAAGKTPKPTAGTIAPSTTAHPPPPMPAKPVQQNVPVKQQ